MTLEEIDRALADWKVKRQRIDDNLVALETDPVCVLLEGAGADGLTGETRDTVVPALAAMRELFDQRRLLDATLQEAERIREGVNRLWPGDAPQRIERLLRGPSIALPPVETPLARRGLLDAADSRTAISPDQLLSAMVSAFEQARDAVATVGAAWDTLTPSVDEARAALADLEKRATDLGADADEALAAARRVVDGVQTLAARDPLHGAEQLTDATTVIAELRARLDAVTAARADAQARLRAATATLAELRTSNETAIRQAAELEATIAVTDPVPGPVTAGRIEGLAEWLTTLERTVGDRRWEPAVIGLDRWQQAAADVLAEARAAGATSGGLLARLDDLTGRLAARRAQASALAARGRAHAPDLESLAAAAADALAARPCTLEEAEQRLRAFEAALRPL